MARKRRTKAEIEAAKGLGDTIEKITEATGIKAAVKAVFGDDCGCEERKEKLNRMFPYRKPNCLTEDEYNYLDAFFSRNANQLTIKDQEQLLRIHNRVLNQKDTMSSCTQCWRERIANLKKIHNEYKG